MTYIRCDRELHFNVGIHLDVPTVPIERRWTLIAGRADRIERAAIHGDVHKRRSVVRAIESLGPRVDVGVLIGGELEHRNIDSGALAVRAQVRRTVDCVVLRRRQAIASWTAAITERKAYTVIDCVEQLRLGRIWSFAAWNRRSCLSRGPYSLRLKAHRIRKTHDAAYSGGQDFWQLNL
jgi:hypothetical protein